MAAVLFIRSFARKMMTDKRVALSLSHSLALPSKVNHVDCDWELFPNAARDAYSAQLNLLGLACSFAHSVMTQRRIPLVAFWSIVRYGPTNEQAALRVSFWNSGFPKHQVPQPLHSLAPVAAT
jgi:hypothetical protein